MSYYLKCGFDDKFSELLMYLKSKYPDKLFSIDGIGDAQTDMNQFSKDFFNTKTTAADLSIDANSNVAQNDIVTYTVELPKPLFKLNSYYVLWKKIRQLYGHEQANTIIEQVLTGDLYVNEMVQLGVGVPYCWNYSCNDVVQLGLPMISKIKSTPPKHLYSFKSQLEQFVIIAANNTAGATGLADLFIVLSIYVNKILKTGKDAHFTFEGWNDVTPGADNSNRTSPYNTELFEKAVWSYLDENITSFIYTINQPARGGIQSPFTNVSVYDSVFLDQLIPGYTAIIDEEVWPAVKTITNTIQEHFLDIMNSELSRTVYTFPVTTACFAVGEDKEIQDKDFLYMIAEKNKEYGFINIYSGSTSSLSSCCVLPDTMIEVFNKETQKNEIISIEDFVHYNSYVSKNEQCESKIASKYSTNSINFNKNVVESSDIVGVLKKVNEYKNVYKFTIGNRTVSVTPDHVFMVKVKETGSLIRIRADKVDKNLHLLPCNFDSSDTLTFNEIYDISVEEYSGFVYDIELEKNHYFFGNGFGFSNCRLRSDTSNRFFSEEKQYEITTESGVKYSVNSLDEITVFNVEENTAETVFPDQIDKKKHLYSNEKIKNVTNAIVKSLNQGREYHNSFGSGSTKIGSIGVATINLPRIAYKNKAEEEFLDELRNTAEVSCKINHAKRHVIQKRIDSGNSSLYTYGFIDIKKQYSTIGIIGLYEAVKLMGYDITQEDGKQFVIKMLNIINAVADKFEKLTKYPHNLEQIPGESACFKLAQKDKLLKYSSADTDYAFYSNQFVPLIADADLIDRIIMQGTYDQYFSGGSILHINIDTKIEDSSKIASLIELAVKKNVVYFALNYCLKECEDGHIFTSPGNCHCGKPAIAMYTRPVGYITRVDSWNKVKREDDFKNRQFYSSI